MSGTIFALATPPGRSGVAVIRISGPEAVDTAQKICTVPAAGQFCLSNIKDSGGGLIDRGLILYFAHGASFTGEDVVEIQCHGSLAVIDKMLKTLNKLGCRDADAGEFTRRALENGALSLIEVEALADLIDAETDAQHDQAIRVFSGSLRQDLDRFGAALRQSIALLEATIDFADEDVPVDVRPQVLDTLQGVVSDVSDLLARSAQSDRVRQGFKIAILGAPNVGKSTLLNRIAGEEIAITSDIAGTTRDIVTVRLDLNGMLVELADTAGLRDTGDRVESIGVQRALSYAKDADIRVFLDDGTRFDWLLSPENGDIVLRPKTDAETDGGISGKTGAGVQALLNQISERLRLSPAADTVLIRERQKRGLSEMERGLFDAVAVLSAGGQEEVAVENLYHARRHLDFVIGRLGVEDVLDDIFLSFCIGK
ncbi:MAG: tRNA uridine-5-carboxymethylaminomethyl(34) synthesis GTPase MnmE [Pseudomonadota bacterium]